ncbi:hypothetical protein Bca101_084165 [Brassica carinata]
MAPEDLKRKLPLVGVASFRSEKDRPSPCDHGDEETDNSEDDPYVRSSSYIFNA